jgi:4-hydroxybenzoyl-CoA thioesterase
MMDCRVEPGNDDADMSRSGRELPERQPARIESIPQSHVVYFSLHRLSSPAMSETRFDAPAGAFTRTRTIRFSHCDAASIVYFPHYFDMFNGLIEDWYTYELGYDYAALITSSRYGFPFVHIECDFKVPSRMGERLDLTLLVTRVGRSSLGLTIVGHLGGGERLRARMVTAMMSLETKKSVEIPAALRARIEAYRRKTASG